MRAFSSLLPFILSLLGLACGGGDTVTGASTSSATSGASTGTSTGTSEDSTDATTTTAATSTSGTSTTGEPTTGEPTTTSTTATASTGTPIDTTTGGALDLPWTYIAAVDKGIRDDDYGLGAFQAPRDGYDHSGIDFSMPIGTDLRAPCDGVYLADYDAGYGNWVQVICPVPATVAGDATVYASLLFAHLDGLAVDVTGIDPNAAGDVVHGQTIGSSGKTGNASAQGIHAHLHFEIALHDSELAALQEAHISGDDVDTPAAMALRAALTAACLEPHGFAPLKTSLSLGRRIDPFILLTCLVGDKPTLTPPADQSLHPWSDDYQADDFDVDVGLQ